MDNITIFRAFWVIDGKEYRYGINKSLPYLIRQMRKSRSKNTQWVIKRYPRVEGRAVIIAQSYSLGEYNG